MWDVGYGCGMWMWDVNVGCWVWMWDVDVVYGMWDVDVGNGCTQVLRFYGSSDAPQLDVDVGCGCGMWMWVVDVLKFSGFMDPQMHPPFLTLALYVLKLSKIITTRNQKSNLNHLSPLDIYIFTTHKIS